MTDKPVVLRFQIELGFGNVHFLITRKGETWRTQKKTSWSKDENQQQMQPTYDAESGNQMWATLAGSKCSLQYAIPAPLSLGTVGSSSETHFL